MGGWANSDRRARLPADWPKRQRACLRRDPVCTCRGELDGCRLHLGRPCSSPSTEADHLVRGDDHSPENLGGKCHPCHERKTIAERLKLAPRRRPPEPHPGMIGG